MGNVRTAAGLVIVLTSRIVSAEFTSVDATGNRLLIGDDQGGLTVADVTGRLGCSYRGFGSEGPTRAAIDFDGIPVWITASGKELRSGSEIPGQVRRWKLAELEMIRQIERVSRWREFIVVHSATETRFLDLRFGRVHYLGDVLPLDVAREARQGVCTTYWGPNGGLFAVMRRYGLKKENAKPGAVEELGLLSAWHCDANGAWQYLGGYSCAVSKFTIDSGPRVEIKQGEKQFSAEFGSTDLANIKVVAEGIVAADASDIIRVPFMKSSWLPDRLRTAIEPRYTKSLVVGANVAWWLDGQKLVGSSLEDGETEVYLRIGGKTEKPKSIAATESRLYALYRDRVEAVRDGDGIVAANWIRYEAGPETAIARSRKHKSILAGAKKPGGPGLQAAIALYRKAGVSSKRISAAIKPAAKTGQLELGDLVRSGGKYSIYIGNGRVQPLVAGRSSMDLELEADAVAYRIIEQPNVSPPVSVAAAGRVGELLLLGVNRPNPSLGHDAFVRVTTGTEFDKPYLDRHYPLADAMQQYLGTPYAWGGNSVNGIDCSGFVCAVFREVGIRLPRHSRDIAYANLGEVVFDTLRFGDVLYYPGEVGRRHVAIYIGNGKTIEARSHGVDYHSVLHRRATIARRFITE